MSHCSFAGIRLYSRIEGWSLVSNEIKQPPADGIYQTYLPYPTFLDRFQSVCRRLLTRDGPWGTHTSRKTAYLLAVWGGGTFESIMTSARHKDIITAKKYERDARYLLAACELNGISLQGTVSKWTPVLVESLQLGRAINERNSRNIESLWKVSTFWLEEMCYLSRSSLNWSISYALETALSYQRQKTSIEAVTHWLESNLRPGANKEEILTLIGDYAKSQVLEAMGTAASGDTDTSADTTNTGTVVIPTGNVQVVVESSESKTKRKRKSGDNDLDGRHEVKKLKLGIVT